MDFIVFSDIHYQMNTKNSKILDNGLTSWLQNQLDITDSIFEFASNNGISTVIHNGDLFEDKHKLNVTLYNIIWKYFKEKSLQGFNIIFNTGNHDVSTLKKTSALCPFSDIVRVIDTPSIVEVNADTLLAIIPFGMINTTNIVPVQSKTNIVLTHEVLPGLVTGSQDIRLEADIDISQFGSWNIILNGHVHKPQDVGNIVNIGSPIPQDFGEANESKRFIHVKGKEIKSIVINHPKFFTFDGLSNRIIKVIEEDDYNYYRVDITPSEISQPIFAKYNVSGRVIKSDGREIRLKEDLSDEEEIKEYISIKNTELDADKLFNIGKEFI